VKEDATMPTIEKLQGKNCYVCGKDNPDGLRIPFYYDGKCVTASFVPGDELCGFEKVVHGGIIFSVADEAMMHLIWAKGLRAITAEVTIRFRNYAKTGEELAVKAEIKEVTRHLIKAQSIIKGTRGKIIARAEGKFLPFSKKENEYFKKLF
jgi:uncharacterized protein (TIGR00369 family)